MALSRRHHMKCTHIKAKAPYRKGWAHAALTTLRPELQTSLRANRNSPARFGSMLNWRRSVSSPAPGRHSGRSPEWHTDTRTDMSTVLQVDCSVPRTEDWAGGGIWAHPPELKAIFCYFYVTIGVITNVTAKIVEFITLSSRHTTDWLGDATIDSERKRKQEICPAFIYFPL